MLSPAAKSCKLAPFFADLLDTEPAHHRQRSRVKLAGKPAHIPRVADGDLQPALVVFLLGVFGGCHSLRRQGPLPADSQTDGAVLAVFRAVEPLGGLVNHERYVLARRLIETGESELDGVIANLPDRLVVGPVLQDLVVDPQGLARIPPFLEALSFPQEGPQSHPLVHVGDMQFLERLSRLFERMASIVGFRLVGRGPPRTCRRRG